MTKLIPILSGRCLVVELPEGATDVGIEKDLYLSGPVVLWYMPDKNGVVNEVGSIELTPGTWQIVGMLSEVTEDGLDGLIKPVKVFDYDAHYWNYKGKEYQPIRVDESLESAILSAGWFFSNPYGSHPDTWDYLLEAMHKKEEDVQNWETAQSRVLDRSRCLLLGREI